ncbi:MAG: hypothetical protein IPN95_23815 [Bacteroidetes bacterium]|nr:hypothetical protein [Bacteroidota bacterium]MBP8073144.1 hypothetical protein [Bacteroidia bacterium]
MNTMPNYPFPALARDPRQCVLSVFNQNPVKPTEVEPWMTPDEIAEIISEKLMVIVRAQFEATRIEFEKEQAAKAEQEV